VPRVLPAGPNFQEFKEARKTSKKDHFLIVLVAVYQFIYTEVTPMKDCASKGYLLDGVPTLGHKCLKYIA